MQVQLLGTKSVRKAFRALHQFRTQNRTIEHVGPLPVRDMHHAMVERYPHFRVTVLNERVKPYKLAAVVQKPAATNAAARHADPTERIVRQRKPR